MIAMDLAYSLDGVAFARAAGYDELDLWQVALMRSPGQQLILNCSRQSGKSTISSLLALHTALYHAEALVLLLAPALRQSQELFRKVKASYGALQHAAAEAREESALRLEFSNGSRIICLPGKEQTIRGFSGVALLVVDEASRVADELYQAVRPMLAVSGGRIILLSTPFGRRGFFHHEWTEGVGWERVMVRATDVPRIPADWLEQERRAIGEWWFRQEYMCEFVETTDSVFRYTDIYGAISSDVQPLFGDKHDPFVFSGP
jgi:hypothetical protein